MWIIFVVPFIVLLAVAIAAKLIARNAPPNNDAADDRWWTAIK